MKNDNARACRSESSSVAQSILSTRGVAVSLSRSPTSRHLVHLASISESTWYLQHEARRSQTLNTLVLVPKMLSFRSSRPISPITIVIALRHPKVDSLTRQNS